MQLYTCRTEVSAGDNASALSSLTPKRGSQSDDALMRLDLCLSRRSDHVDARHKIRGVLNRMQVGLPNVFAGEAHLESAQSGPQRMRTTRTRERRRY